MARRSRLQFPGAVYHVMSRGNRKSMIVDDDGDRRTFMTIFSDVTRGSAVRVYACCLMGTHYHALFDTPHGNLSGFIQTLNSEYSKAFNRRHERVGHTFKQRFDSIVVQREKYLRRVARYIALNPVKARLCGDPAEWLWSTHRATAGLEEAPTWLHLEWLRWAFRADTLREAQRRYQDYVRDPAGLTWSFESTAALGTARFKKTIGASLVDRCAEDRPLLSDCHRWVRPPLAHVFAREETDLRSRNALIVVSRQTHGYRVAEIAKFLGLAPSTVSKVLSRARRR